MTAPLCPRCSGALVVEECYPTPYTAHCTNCYDAELVGEDWHGGPMGYGSTPEEAVEDLRETMQMEATRNG